jgi:hypothetical protein
LADDLTREVIPYKAFQVSINGIKKQPLYKEDGYFVFSDIEESDDEYEFHLTSKHYQTRIIKKNLITNSPVELTYDGEDELYVFIKGVQDSTEKKVTFNKIAFLKTIPEGSLVIGQGGFSSKLTETIEGEDVEFAILENVSGLSAGKILRFIRSNNMVMRASSYSPFEKETTLLSLKFIEDDPAETPITTVKVEIKKVNDLPIVSVPIGTLEIKTVTLAGQELVLGTVNDITTYSNPRGDCIFYYSPETPITKLTLKITKDGFTPTTEEIDLTAKERTARDISLERT